MRELALEIIDKLGCVRRNTDLLAVGLNQLVVFLPGHQLVAVIAETFASGNTEIDGFELPHSAGQHAEFQISPIDGLELAT
jgi:hypothetical protein